MNEYRQREEDDEARLEVPRVGVVVEGGGARGDCVRDPEGGERDKRDEHL